jgi:hypothetical protein
MNAMHACMYVYTRTYVNYTPVDANTIMRTPSRNVSSFLRMNSLGVFDAFDQTNNFPNKPLKRSA